MCNRFEALQDLYSDEDNLDKQWERVKETVLDTCRETLGPNKSNQKEWISEDTLQKVEERKRRKNVVNNSRTRAQTAKAQKDYNDAQRAVQQSVRKDKRSYMESLADDAEKASQKGNIRDLYSIIRTISGKFNKSERPVKDKDGKPILDGEGQKRRWMEHFEDLLNRPEPPEPPDIQPATEDLPINCGLPTKDEIRKAIIQLKNRKSAGPDGIPAEALKADPTVSVEMLHSLFQKIWEEEDIPAEWKEGYLIKIL